MTPVLFSELANDDLTEIWVYVSSARGDDFADRYLDDLSIRIGQLAENPELGRVRDDIRLHARMMVLAPHLILYEFSGNVVRIVRVVHGKRDLTKLKWDADIG